MSDFDDDLAMVLDRFGGVGGHGSIDTAKSEITALVQRAIETPLYSSAIDIVLVRTMMGKAGSRYASVQSGDRRVEYRTDPRAEIFWRVFIAERQRNNGVELSALTAMYALKAFSSMPLPPETEGNPDGTQ